MSKFALTNHIQVYLKKNKAKPLWARHPWVFGGAIHKITGNREEGDIAEVFDENRDFIAKGFLNEDSPIPVRLLSWDIHEKIDGHFFHDKIAQAIQLREKLAIRSKANAYRLINGEGDGLPGLIVDRYQQVVVVQFLNPGMERRRDLLLGILKTVTKAEILVERYHPQWCRDSEGMEKLDYKAEGPEPPQIIQIQEYGVNFAVNIAKGQRTGFYLDQRENRMALCPYAFHKRVLDAGCYTGAFGVYLLAKGKASEAVFLDSSTFALDMAKKNLELNHIDAKVQFTKAELETKLPEMEEGGERFDIVVLDPPAITPGAAPLFQELESLKKLNIAALRMLQPQGILLSCERTDTLDSGEFFRLLSDAARKAGRTLQILEYRGAGQDHPFPPACPEYGQALKVVIGIVT